MAQHEQKVILAARHLHEIFLKHQTRHLYKLQHHVHNNVQFHQGQKQHLLIGPGHWWV